MTRYQVVEFDVNDKATVLRRGLTQGEARERLQRLRDVYGQHGLRYIMRPRSLPE